MQFINKIHPGDDSSSGGWARLDGGYRLKPDILNPTIQTFLEINPFTLSGMYSGTLQLALYSAAFAPSGYFPEFDWVPSRNDIRINGRAALFVNAGGLVFYTDELRLSQEFLAITTAVARELLRLGAFGEVGQILQVARLGSTASQLYLEADVSLVEATGAWY